MLEPWPGKWDLPLPVTLALGTPVPHHRHAISVQLPTWNDMVGLGCHHARIIDVQKGGYPRSFLHQDVVKLSLLCLEACEESSEACLLFPTFQDAQACIKYLASNCDSHLEHDHLKCYVATFGLYASGSTVRPDINVSAAIFPKSLRQQGLVFWRLTGLGISSRMAEACLAMNLRRLQQPRNQNEVFQYTRSGCHNDTIAHDSLRRRLAGLYNRTTSDTAISTPVTKDEVYLYPTGMAAIYHAHQLLLKMRGTKTVVFGFPYELTLKMVQTYGPAWEFWGLGTDDELDQFEASLESGNAGSQVQAVWCECASNPLLRTVDLARIYRVAERYDFIVVVDDTIGSVANVDVLDVADIVVTSLTKSFSGYANVMAGSIMLNPRSRHHALLRSTLEETYVSLLFRDDAKQLELNSRDYLERSHQTNEAAAKLAQIMKTWSSKIGGPFISIYYPEMCWSKYNYVQRMRPVTEEYTPGFGSLFTIELADVETAAVFFDALTVHKGPSLGAQYTLAQPYVQTVFQKEKDWAARYGLSESIVRISVGLEDCGSLVLAFTKAAQVADEAYRRRCGTLKAEL